MKVTTKAIYDIESGKLIAEDSYEYSGPVAWADFGGGGGADSSGASQAAATTAALYNQMYEQSRKDLTPYRQVGESTTPYYAGILNIPGYDKIDPTQALQETPGYNWMFDQGVEAIDRSAAGKGMLGSGAMGKGLMKYGQGMADQSYNNYMNRLYSLIGTGQNAAAQTGQFGMQAAQGTGNALMQAGQAQDQAAYYNSQNQGQGLNSLMGGLGLLGGVALSPLPSGGWKNTVAGSLFS